MKDVWPSLILQFQVVLSEVSVSLHIRFTNIFRSFNAIVKKQNKQNKNNYEIVTFGLKLKKYIFQNTRQTKLIMTIDVTNITLRKIQVTCS